MIKTKCLTAPPESSDGKRFLVTRFWPQFKSKAELQIEGWIPAVAPSHALLKDWKDGKISWRQYVARYKNEMREQEEVITTLAALAQKDTITLLCYEREGDPHCHRHLLKEMIEQTTEQSKGAVLLLPASCGVA